MRLRRTAATPRATDPSARSYGRASGTYVACGPSSYAALIGEVDGVRLLPLARLREVSAVAFGGVDEIMGNPVSWALGYALGRPGGDPEGPSTAFGMGGAGGSYAYADTAAGITFALIKNRLTPDFAAAEQIAGIVTKAVA